eukprot:GHRR01005339.1.p1 GENE.GHRR01005339.1~~GHRR01005339.1.p1  ORF type:complete len:179 (+),score=34.79 GHRR01005339.1:849-1385(+)
MTDASPELCVRLEEPFFINCTFACSKGITNVHLSKHAVLHVVDAVSSMHRLPCCNMQLFNLSYAPMASTYLDAEMLWPGRDNTWASITIAHWSVAVLLIASDKAVHHLMPLQRTAPHHLDTFLRKHISYGAFIYFISQVGQVHYLAVTMPIGLSSLCHLLPKLARFSIGLLLASLVLR